MEIIKSKIVFDGTVDKNIVIDLKSLGFTDDDIKREILVISNFTIDTEICPYCEEHPTATFQYPTAKQSVICSCEKTRFDFTLEWKCN